MSITQIIRGEDEKGDYAMKVAGIRKFVLWRKEERKWFKKHDKSKPDRLNIQQLTYYCTSKICLANLIVPFLENASS